MNWRELGQCEVSFKGKRREVCLVHSKESETQIQLILGSSAK